MTDAELEAERVAIQIEERSLIEITERLRGPRMTGRDMRPITNACKCIWLVFAPSRMRFINARTHSVQSEHHSISN
jgi:hypothetical protein